MLLSLLLPGLATLLLGSALGFLELPLRPSAALKLVTSVAFAVAAMTAFMAGSLAIGFAARSSVVASVIARCPAVPSHHRVGAIEGSLAFAALGMMVFRVRRVVVDRRNAMRPTRGKRFSVLDTDEPIAYAAPGKPGCVVVSRGLLKELSAAERQVVFAHERAHLDLRHDRHLFVAAVAVAVCPLLWPLADRVRLQTERCADEAAVDALQGDRQLVAGAIVRAAVATTAFGRLVPSLGGGSVVKRVSALSHPRVDPNVRVAAAAVVAVAFTGLTTTSIQVHHIAELVAHVCGR
jgi:Zn-dependent protease with chaperone function